MSDSMSDDLCAKRGLQSDVVEDANKLGVKLLSGTTNFVSDLQNYLTHNKGKDLDLGCALRRIDPQDVRVGTSPDGKPGWTVDAWRPAVNESVGELSRDRSNPSALNSTIGAIKARYDRVSPESKDIFIADFNRTCLRYSVPFMASKSGSSIDINKKN